MCWRDDIPMHRRCSMCGRPYYGDLGHRNCPGRITDAEREYRSWFPIQPRTPGVSASDSKTAAPVVQVVEPLTSAARDVLAERQRQISAEGWTPEHDDEHAGGSMAFAAAAYAVHADVGPRMSGPLWNWTGWSRDWWKPKDHRRNLIRAAALLIAEIERLDRKENT